ncbi:MAG TPA: phytanoyl-CoA dioxygenase family protein [Acidimicrobiales bacterium]|nr:phytanoyl-CoA dioxygenase family protein [Acidimicrobiales bacterium]
MPGRQPLDLSVAAEHFRTHGWVLVDSLIPAADLAAAQPALARAYPPPPVGEPKTGERLFRPGQFTGLREAPLGEPALDNLCVHDRVLDLVEALLGTSDIRLYQAETFAKFTGVESYEQPLHIDETNHTLLPPRRDGAFRQVQLFVYLSDVTEERGATHVVSRTRTGEIPKEQLYFDRSGAVVMDADEVAAEGPAGSVLAYSADTVHRGTDMTEPGASRFFFNLGYRIGGTDWVGALPWPRRGIDPRIPAWLSQLSTRQLCALGFPPPGHPYWDDETLAATQARYPQMDLTGFR